MNDKIKKKKLIKELMKKITNKKWGLILEYSQLKRLPWNLNWPMHVLRDETEKKKKTL